MPRWVDQALEGFVRPSGELLPVVKGGYTALKGDVELGELGLLLDTAPYPPGYKRRYNPCCGSVRFEP